MRKSLIPISSLLALSLALLALAGCGGGESVVHIQGLSASISKATLKHWMQALVGSDFRTSNATVAPAGLVSEPADYKRCAAAVRLVAPRTQPRPSDTIVAERCRQLYRGIKAQALSFLISAAWTVGEGAEMGLKVSEAQLKRQFAVERRQTYPTEAQLNKYLSERHMVLSDLLYQLKRSILVSEILPKFEAKVRKAGGKNAYGRLAIARYDALVARTSCSPGYVVPNCKEYHGPEAVVPSPNQVLEAIVQGGTAG
jgi:hypothetical protein